MTIDELLMALALLYVLDDELEDWDMPSQQWHDLYDTYTDLSSTIFFSAIKHLPSAKDIHGNVAPIDMARTLVIVGL